MNIDLTQTDPQTCYRLLVGSIIPRPIAWISTLGSNGVANLAPYSFFTVASCNPPVLCINQVNPRAKKEKDTLANLRARGEAVVNIVSADVVEQMNASCADYPADISEFTSLGIAQSTSCKVSPPGVAAAKVRLECTLRDIIEISSLPMGGTMMLLDVIHIYVNENVLENNVISPALLNAVGKLGGDHYTFTRDQFELARPQLT